MTLDEDRFDIVRSIAEECIEDEELSNLLKNKPHPICYDGFEPSGRMHIAQGVMKVINVNKLTSAGCKVKILIADWHAQLNHKMGGDLKKIQDVGKYLKEIWKAAGMVVENVEFVLSSEIINSNAGEYWRLVIDITRKNTLARIRRCSQIMGRKETDKLSAAQMLYPLMQCADVFFLEADICQLGTDQTKVNMLAREYSKATKRKNKPIILSHHMLPGLLQGQEKMSKSDSSSAVFMEDDEAEVKEKIQNAFCPPGIVKGNPCLEYIKYLVFPWFNEFKVQRREENGHTKVFTKYEELVTDYEKGDLHPADLKPALSEALNKILQPVRDHFKTDENAKALLKKVKGYSNSKATEESAEQALQEDEEITTIDDELSGTSLENKYPSMRASSAFDINTELPNDSNSLFSKPSSEQYRTGNMQPSKNSINKHLAGSIPPEELSFVHRDPQGEIQGPFLGVDIISWFEQNFFVTELPVRVADAPEGTPFEELGTVMPHLTATPNFPTQDDTSPNMDNCGVYNGELDNGIAVPASVSEMGNGTDDSRWQELRVLLSNKLNPICLDGFEPSGRMHIGQGITRIINTNKLTSAGCKMKILIADWCAQLNNKLGGDIKKIHVVGEYMKEVWKAAGMNVENVEFPLSSDVINKEADKYWPLVMDIATRNSCSRILRCSPIMGRNQKDDLIAAQILYPLMQCADVIFLKADICQMGMDQIEVNVLAREYCDAIKRKNKPIILAHHMLPGLLKGQEKMSTSDSSSAIFMDDEEAEVNLKIKKAYCPPCIVEGNPCLEYIKYIIFPWFNEFKVERKKENGGAKAFTNYDELVADYKKGDLHPGDLKPALSKALNKILKPVRDHFKNDEKAKALLKKVKGYNVTK